MGGWLPRRLDEGDGWYAVVGMRGPIQCFLIWFGLRSLDIIQVLRDEIGTAMMNKNSRADQFFLIIHGQEGEGEEKE